MAERLPAQPWPPVPAWSGAGWDAPPRPVSGVVTWNINTACNYRCSYCTQRFKEDRNRRGEDYPAFLAVFGQLPGAWEVKISGGEPFLHPHLPAVAAGLRSLGHTVSIVTNLSAPLAALGSFLVAAGPALRVFSASLHLEYVGDDAGLAGFLERASYVQAHLELPGSFNATCVATRANLPRLPALVERFAAAGIRLKIQPEKQDRRVIAYSEAERQQLLALGGHNQLGEVSFHFQGRPCWAGALAFTLDDRGDAWRCYPARRFRAQYLGNFLDGSFRLATGPSPCLYPDCTCTVPIERGMMATGVQRSES